MTTPALTRIARPLSLLAALGALAFLSAAHATEASSDRAAAPTARVRIADLDLASARGTRELRTRLEQAAHAVCTPESYRDLAALSAAAACRHAAVQGALAQLQKSELARLAQRADVARR